mmetsp:Transcript_54138/g.87631  ORF Transcript_54138/g.87631 Transcript_54138/m.87631 type:complete len:138 (-) Transcript_54138:931-1344(-)
MCVLSCDSLGPENKAHGKASGWANNIYCFCGGAQQSPIDLCSATTITAGNKDSQVKLSLTNVTTISAMKLKCGAQCISASYCPFTSHVCILLLLTKVCSVQLTCIYHFVFTRSARTDNFTYPLRRPPYTQPTATALV